MIHKWDRGRSQLINFRSNGRWCRVLDSELIILIHNSRHDTITPRVLLVTSTMARRAWSM